MIVPYNHVLLLVGLLFLMGMFCVVTRRNLIMILLGLEIMLNAAAIAFVGAALHWQHLEGQVMVIFIMAVAAAGIFMAEIRQNIKLRAHSLQRCENF